jgi:hypothetical protein
MGLPHTQNLIIGSKNTAGSGGVGGNDYPTSGEAILDRESPSTTVITDFFGFRQDLPSSADSDVILDFFYDTILGGLSVRTTNNGSSANGSNTTETFRYYTTANVAGNIADGSSRIHYSNDSAVSGETYPGPADQIKVVHSSETVADIGNTSRVFSMNTYHYAGTGAPATIASYTNDTWTTLHNIGGQSGIDVPTDSVGIRVRMNNYCGASPGGTNTSRLTTRETIECWVKAIGGYDDTLLFKYDVENKARAESSY